MANVSIPSLVEAIEKRRVLRVSEYEKASATYEKELKTWRGEVAKRFKEIAANMAKLDDDAYWHDYQGRGTIQITVPGKPNAPTKPDFEQLDRDLASLKLMVDESIKLKTDSNYFRYL